MKRIVVLPIVIFTLCITVVAQQSPVFIKDNKAIRGFDPVAYFTENKPVEGKSEFVYAWDNANWYFSSQQNLDSFKTNPGRYAPQYGGYCAYGMFEGHKAPTSPDAWTIVEGKLYFNYNLKVRELWRDRKEEKITVADKNWPVIKNKE